MELHNIAETAYPEKPKRKKVGGRPKGGKNLITTAAKDAIAMAAFRLGGYQRLYEWAKENKANERIFWSTVYPKLLPHQVSGQIDSNITISWKS